MNQTFYTNERQKTALHLRDLSEALRPKWSQRLMDQAEQALEATLSKHNLQAQGRAYWLITSGRTAKQPGVKMILNQHCTLPPNRLDFLETQCRPNSQGVRLESNNRLTYYGQLEAELAGNVHISIRLECSGDPDDYLTLLQIGKIKSEMSPARIDHYLTCY